MDLDTDVLILVKFSKEKENHLLLPCRKKRLTFRSDFFKSMFDERNSSFKLAEAKRDKDGTPIVELKVGNKLRVDEKHMLKYLRFLHAVTETKMHVKSENLVKIWQVAEFFQDRDLIETMNRKINEDIQNKKMSIEDLMLLTKVTDMFDRQIREGFDKFRSDFNKDLKRIYPIGQGGIKCRGNFDYAGNCYQLCKCCLAHASAIEASPFYKL